MIAGIPKDSPYNMQCEDIWEGQKVLYEPKMSEEDHTRPSLLACPLGTI